MIRWIVIGCLITAVLLISAAFILANYWVGLPLVIVIGGIWLVGVWHSRSWLTTLGLVGMVMVTAVGAVLGLSPILLLTGVALAVFAWSMGNVARLLNAVSDVRDESSLIKTHVQWTGGVIGLGWLLGLIALNGQFSLKFGWVMGLGVVIVLALSWFVRRLQQESVV
jgi:hypothetical protein